MMDGLNGRLSENSSNVELTKQNSHSNSVELDPLTGATNRSDYSRKLTERVQSDVEKLQDGSIHRHRYKLHERDENKNESTSLTGERASALPGLSSAVSPRISRLPTSSATSRVRHLLDDDDDDLGSSRRIKDYEPVGARLASELGIEVKSKPVSFNFECEAKRRAHNLMLKEIDDEDEKFRTLPPKEPHRYKAREQMFANDWSPKELRYLSREARQE